MQHTDLITEFDALSGVNHPVSRRTALRTVLGAGLGIGYAAAARPVMAQTAIQTPEDGLTAGRVEIGIEFGNAHIVSRAPRLQ